MKKSKPSDLDQLLKRVSDIAHDFNNLLTIIGGYTYVLFQQHEGNRDTQRKLQAITDAVTRGSTLTEQLQALDEDDNLSLTDKTVLIVDDEEDLLSVLEIQLQHMGLKVLKAANADTALLLQKDYSGDIDFLLTDIVMPGINGIELAKRMIGKAPNMGVIYMTGYNRHARTLDLPADSAILPKPLRPEDLSSALQKALEKVEDA